MYHKGVCVAQRSARHCSRTVQSQGGPRLHLEPIVTTTLPEWTSLYDIRATLSGDEEKVLSPAIPNGAVHDEDFAIRRITESDDRIDAALLKRDMQELAGSQRDTVDGCSPTEKMSLDRLSGLERQGEMYQSLRRPRILSMGVSRRFIALPAAGDADRGQSRCAGNAQGSDGADS
jgi:hypothetical protein